MDAKSVGANIAELRKQAGMTQQQLADRLALTNKAVSKWETGEGFPDITILPALAQTLGVSADDILCGGNANRNSFTLLPIITPLMAAYSIIAVFLLFVIYNPETGWPVSYIDPAALLVTTAIGLPAAYLIMKLFKSDNYISYLLAFGLPVGGAVSFVTGAASLLGSGEWTRYYYIALIPFLYVTILSLLIFIIFNIYKNPRRGKRAIG